MQEPVVEKYPLNQIYFYLTEGCNLHCRHCWIAPKYQDSKHTYPSLPFNLFQSIIKQARPLGLAAVKLTGGEPLMHPDINNILELIKQENLGLGIETNGVFCTPDVSRRIAECNAPFVSVSLDGVNADTHEWVRGVKGCFNDTISGIKNLVETGVSPQIIMTVMRHNKGQMEEMIRLAETLGASSVKFNIVQPTARGKHLHNSGETLSIEELIHIGEWVENILSSSTSLKIFFGHPPAFRPLARMFGENSNGCGICGIKGIIGVLSDGSYALCGIGESIPEMVFGNATKDRLSDVWNNTLTLKEIREKIPGHLEGVCKGCLMKNICLGSCIAQNYYRTSSLWSPFWYCEESLKLNMFPGSRLIKNDI
ncbi:conserved hypothetical protein [Methanocella paludicola SANAE]|uniref:Radical SAM core domain-containing protein n=1 Tax=Methanocella paludicola (strain DSM 17711 / JCM 13418 / NBRC 101707 / SANAE) TaxID=304371 RepID=D1YWY4_METPS|nr:SynChlorMet cassette radical SAM/SPASM protein ScmF [Methanocella paludicola]BAI60956.1 conserved hypothetical protein [Methanocella paludicola SANAE]